MSKYVFFLLLIIFPLSGCSRITNSNINATNLTENKNIADQLPSCREIGQVTVSGRYWEDNSGTMYSGFFCFDISEESRKKLPPEANTFCFSDQDEAKKLFGIDEQKIWNYTGSGEANDWIEGQATIKISDYTICPKNNSDYDEVKLDQIINQTPYRHIIENEYLQISILPGWSVQALLGGAVNIVKYNYIFYVNPFAQQASGVEGGRFSEIAQGAPGVELVLKSHPADPCGKIEQTTFGTDSKSALDRRDIFVNADELENNCNAPTNGQTVWYFSYFTLNSGGYLSKSSYYNPLITDETRQFVITATYQTDDINKLPTKDSAEYKKMIQEMTEMAQGIKLK